MLKMKKPVPFDFVLHELESLALRVKPMFGAHAVYVQEKIMLILTDRMKELSDRGLWLATTHEHHASLQKDFPSMRSIKTFGPGPSGWQVLPQESDDFEESAMKVCKFILAGDPRIGKVPKARPIRRPKGMATNLRKKVASKPKKKVSFKKKVIRRKGRAPR